MRAYVRDLELKKQAGAAIEPPKNKWAVIAPDLFPGEQILCVMDEKYLEEAQRENPGLVTYSLSEIDALRRCKSDADVLTKIHMLKKAFGGWIKAPTDGCPSSL